MATSSRSAPSARREFLKARKSWTSPGSPSSRGLVMMHEHLYYPTGPGVYGAEYVSFSRLYLAGGVTSMRTGGNVGGYADLNLAAAIKAGTQVGPWIDAPAPYANGPSPFAQL